MAKLRLLHALALDTVGGVECTFADYLRHSDRENIEHHVLVTHGPIHPRFEEVIHENASSVSFSKYWRGIKLPRWRSLRRKHLFKGISRVSPDLIVLKNCLGVMDLSEAASACAPVIYTEHGAAWAEHSEKEVETFFSKTSGVVCNSRASLRVLQLKWNCRVKNILFRHNPVRSDFESLQFGSDKKVQHSPLRLGVMGRLVSFKGFPLALHAVHRLLKEGISCELLIAGAGREEPCLRKIAESLSLGAAAKFCGLHPNPAEFFRDIDILLCPSIREPFGNVAIEAAYAGCPVIAAAVDGLPEAVEDGLTGICIQPALPLSDYPGFGGAVEQCPRWVFDPRSDSIAPPKILAPEAIADAVGSFVRAPDKWREMGVAARARAGSNFRMKDYANWYDRYFLEFATGR